MIRIALAVAAAVVLAFPAAAPAGTPSADTAPCDPCPWSPLTTFVTRCAAIAVNEVEETVATGEFDGIACPL